MFARLFLTIIGLACASAAALVFLPVAIIFDPLVQRLATHMPADHWFDILAGLLSDEEPEEAVAAFFQLIWTIGMLICITPVTIAALVGSVSRARSFLFYAGFSGFIAAAMPWILRASRFSERSAQASSGEGHLTAILFMTGALAGTIYWLIAARESGAKPTGWMSDQPRG